jgi:YHS domain-containing protein
MSQVKDPVCGRVIQQAAAAGRITHDFGEAYFCSDSCRRAFEASPERFLPERHEPPYTVSGKIVAPKFGSAASGGLEHEPAPERHEEGRGERKR